MIRWRRRAWPAIGTALLLAAFLAAIGLRRAAAQFALAQVQANTDTPNAKDAPEGVYVPESETAMERLSLAQKMERLKEWNKSADLYQEVLTDPKYATKVVAAEGDADQRLYRSVEELVMQRLARWPQEGLDVYRARFETPASTLLQSVKGDDLTALHQVFSRYFVTDSGKAAGIQLADRYLESGEFRAAAGIAERLLQWHPNLGADRASIVYRAALAFHLAGDDREAKAYLADLKKHDAEAKGTVRGREVVLADSLASELDQPAPSLAGASGDSYTTYGGDASRNRVVAVSGTPGAHLYSIPLSKVTFPPTPKGIGDEAQYKDEVRNGLTLGIMPVIDRGELFFQDAVRIYAVDLESGVPLAEWVKRNGPDHGGAYRLPGIGESRRLRQLTLTVTDREVLAVMGEEDPERNRAFVQQPGNTRLVCINRENGGQKWIVQPGQFKQDTLRTVQMGGAPLVVGDNVLIVGTAVKQAGFEDSYILCFALEDGSLRWATNIASSQTLWQPMGMFSGFYLAPNYSHLAYANGRVFVQTNRGAVAAVDLYNGMIDWLATYGRGPQATNPGFNPMMVRQQGGPIQNQTKPWTFNPVIVSQGLVFTLPLEGRSLLIYDAVSGKRFKQIDLDDLGQRVRSDDDIEPLKYDTLVGVSGDMLVLASNKSVVAMNWKAYNGQRYSDRTMLFWEEGYAQELRGRPFLSQDNLYVATQERMFIVNLKSGVAEKDYPQYPRTWGDDEGPGNIIVTADHAVIAGAEHVDVYTDLAAAKSKLDREVAQSPDDPQPRLRYAEVTYAAGDYKTSLAKLDEAIDRAGGNQLRPGPVRDRIFNDALTFAQKLRGDATPEGRQRVETLFDRAAQAAYSPQQQVNYRIARAAFDQVKDDLAAAVELYQQVLSDPQWRSVSLSDENPGKNAGPASADVRARDEIAVLMRRDSSVYTKFETEAAQALQKAQEASDPDKLLAVAQIYPNSSIAPKAMLAAANAYETSHQPRQARRVLLDMYFDRDVKSDQRAQIIEALARTDLASAPRVLSEGASDLNDPKLQQPMKRADGGQIEAGTKFSAAAMTLTQKQTAQMAQTLPTLKLPLPPGADQDTPYPKPFKQDVPVLANVDALVLPLAHFARNDRIITWSSPSALSIYAPPAQTPLHTSNQIGERPRGSAWIANNLLVWGSKQISLLRDDGSGIAWTSDIASLPAVEVLTPDEAPDSSVAENNAAAPQPRFIMGRGGRPVGVRLPMQPPQPQQPVPVPVGPEQIDHVLPLSDHLVVATSSGRVASLGMADGKVAWQIRLSDRPVTRVVANEDFTVILAESTATVRLQVLDTASGHVRTSRWFARSTNSLPQNIALATDGTLVYTLNDRICLKNLYKPDRGWNQRSIEHALPNPGNFVGLSGEDQLVIAGQRVIAVFDSGGGNRAGEKFVHIYSLQSGSPTVVQVGPKQQIEQKLSAATKSPQVRLLVAGSRLFTVASDAANAYDLDHPEQSVAMYNPQSEPLVVSQPVLAKDFLVFLADDEQQVDAAAAPAAPVRKDPQTSVQLSAYGRALGPRGEIDRLDYQLKIDDQAGITREWQAFDGGICYRTADRKLHLLIGAGG